MRRAVAILVGLTVLAFLFMIPGSGGVGPVSAAGVIRIGVDFPMSGGEAPNGVPSNNGVLLAIDDANKAGGYNGMMFEEVLKDDAVNGVHDPAQGAKNIQELLADSQVVGIVGNFNSNVGKATIPITNSAGVVQISPSQTNPTLTKPPDALQVRRAHPDQINYFRVCTTDDIQGPVGAGYAFKVLNARKVAILDDTETYGKGIADAFEQRFRILGGTVLSHDGIPKGTQDFHAILTKIKAEGPDLVYFGGVTTTGGGLVRKQMPDVGLAIPYEGGDGIVEDEFLKVAGNAANGSFGTVASVNVKAIAAAQAFVSGYKAKFHEDPGAYSANSYVAATIIIDAVKAVGPDRAKVRAWVAALRGYKSIIGTFSFDANGDTTNRVISIYQVKDGKWEWVDQMNLFI